MADIEIKAKIIAETGDATSKIDNVKGSIANTNKEVANSSTQFNNLKKSLSEISPAAESASKASGMFNNALNLLRANPIIATITVLVGLVIALFQPFKKMEAVSDSLGKAWGTLSGVFSKFINGILTPLIDGFTKLVDLFTNGVVSILETLGITSKETADRMGEITDALDDLEDSEKDAAIAMAESNRKLQEAREIAGDANVPIKERIEALKLAGKIEKEELDKVVEVNKTKAGLVLESIAMELGAKDELIAKIKEGTLESLKSARVELASMKNVDKEKLYAIDQQIIAAENAAAQSAKIGKKTQAQIDSLNREQAAKEKEAADKAKAEREKQLANEKQYQDLKTKLVFDAEISRITNEELLAIVKQKQQFEQQQKQIEALKVDAKKKHDLLVIAEKAMQDDIKKIQQKFLEDRQKKQDEENKKIIEEQAKKDKEILDAAAKEIEAQEKAEQKKIDAEIARKNKQFDLKKELDKSGLTPEQLELQKLEETYLAKLAIAQGNEALITQITEENEKAKAEIRRAYQQIQLNETKDVLGKVTDVIGKETAVGKGLGVATALINTYQGATDALRAKSTLPSPFDVVAKIANVSAVLATGFKAVKAITAVQVPSGGGGGSTPSVPAPITPQQISTQLNNASIQGVGNAASAGVGRSFVLDTDIKNNQEMQARINRAARLG